MQLKHLDYPLSVDSIGVDGSFAGYASIFNITDRQKDMVLKGAFTRTLSEKNNGTDIKLLWQHRPDEPIGIITMLKEDARGLYVEGKLLLDVQRGREAYALLKSGAMEGLSIGYNAVDYEIDDTGIRLIKDIDLWEVSLVTFPANQEAGVTVVKGDILQEVAASCSTPYLPPLKGGEWRGEAVTSNRPATIRQFEHFLRDAGFSRAQAKTISLFGFKSLLDQRDVEGGGEAELESAFDRALRAIS